MTNADLIAKCRELSAKATPGPWESHVSFDVTGYPKFPIHGMSGDQKRDMSTLEADATFIAESRTLLDQLADALEQVTRERDEALEVTTEATDSIVSHFILE